MFLIQKNPETTATTITENERKISSDFSTGGENISNSLSKVPFIIILLQYLS